MKTLLIKDLPQTEGLDGKAMSAIHGGMMNLLKVQPNKPTDDGNGGGSMQNAWGINDLGGISGSAGLSGPYGTK